MALQERNTSLIYEILPWYSVKLLLINASMLKSQHFSGKNSCLISIHLWKSSNFRRITWHNLAIHYFSCPLDMLLLIYATITPQRRQVYLAMVVLRWMYISTFLQSQPCWKSLFRWREISTEKRQKLKQRQQKIVWRGVERTVLKQPKKFRDVQQLQ